MKKLQTAEHIVDEIFSLLMTDEEAEKLRELRAYCATLIQSYSQEQIQKEKLKCQSLQQAS